MLTLISVSEAIADVKNLVPVYFPTAGAGSGAWHQEARILPREYDRRLTAVL